MKPAMTHREIDLLNRYINTCKNYFEFGIGGSTVYVCNNTNANIRGVDSSTEWISNVQKMVDNKRVKLTHIDIGPTREWGNPVDDSFKHKWSDYYTSIHKTDIEPDLILVDGRFRINCILQSILFSIEKNIDPIISLHDCQRPGYKHGTDYLECIDRSDNLAMFKISKDRIDIDMLNSTSDKFKYNFG